MATDIDIANLGLAHIGNEAIVQSINPPDGSAEADHCARFFPIVRDRVLEWGWNFNTRRAQLAALVEEPVGSWLFAYTLPNDTLRVIAVYEPDESDENNIQPFVQETNDAGEPVIYTNVEDAVIKYAKRITDTAKFSVSCVDAMGEMMASELAGPIIKGDAGRKVALEHYKLARAKYEEARALDANANNLATVSSFVGTHIAAREA